MSRHVTELTMGKAGDPVPPGSYKTHFQLCEETEGNPAYPPAYRWAWEISEGEFVGREVSRITSQKLNAESNAGKLIASLAGGPVEADQQINLQDYVGQKYLCSVVETKSGGTKVDSVFKI